MLLSLKELFAVCPCPWAKPKREIPMTGADETCVVLYLLKLLLFVIFVEPVESVLSKSDVPAWTAATASLMDMTVGVS